MKRPLLIKAAIPEYNVQKASLIPEYSIDSKESCGHDKKQQHKKELKRILQGFLIRNLDYPLEAAPVVCLQHVL